MITTKVIPGAWYLDSRPDGGYCANIWHGRSIETHEGLVAKPFGDDVLWLALAFQGERFAGQSQIGLRGWEYRPETDWVVTEAPCGVWPVIYDKNGVLIISHCEAGVGSQGYRYIDYNNKPVTGDATVLVRHGLNEWTDLSLMQDGSTLVGQDHEGRGVGVWAGGRLRLLTLGACFNVRARHDFGTDRVSISCYNVSPDGVEGRIFWMTWNDLVNIETPDLPPAQPVMLKPEVTVDLFNFSPANNLKDGDYLKFHDRENLNGAQISVWVEGGAMYMSIRYPQSGTGQTGLPRSVR